MLIVIINLPNFAINTWLGNFTIQQEYMKTSWHLYGWPKRIFWCTWPDNKYKTEYLGKQNYNFLNVQQQNKVKWPDCRTQWLAGLFEITLRFTILMTRQYECEISRVHSCTLHAINYSFETHFAIRNEYKIEETLRWIQIIWFYMYNL